jgi:hypothetical protein
MLSGLWFDLILYSCLIDSIGFRSAALFAGRYPKVIPTITEKLKAMKIE